MHRKWQSHQCGNGLEKALLPHEHLEQSIQPKATESGKFQRIVSLGQNRKLSSIVNLDKYEVYTNAQWDLML
jgi:hypothetical protein